MLCPRSRVVQALFVTRHVDNPPTCRLQHGLGMQVVAKSDLGTGNSVCTSFVLNSGELTFMVTAPQSTANIQEGSPCPFPGYKCDAAFEFVKKHGIAVRAIGEMLPAVSRLNHTPSSLEEC